MAGRRGGWSQQKRDRVLAAQCHGEAWRRVEAGDESVRVIVEGIRRMAGGRREVLLEAGGVAAGVWSVRPDRGVVELLVAAVLLRAAEADGLEAEVSRWVQVGRVRASQRPHTAS